MEKLIAFLNGLSPEERLTFEQRTGTSIGYLRKAASKGQNLGSKLCSLIEIASFGKVMRWHLHPTDWWVTWPELIELDGAPSVQEAANG